VTDLIPSRDIKILTGDFFGPDRLKAIFLKLSVHTLK